MSSLVPVRTAKYGLGAILLIMGIGPAHAVYFATYEAVKHLMGGNQAGVHHPLAAGMFCPFWTRLAHCIDFSSYEWSLCYNCE